MPRIERAQAIGSSREKLRSGEYDAGQYRRITKSGQGIWLQASYNPVLDSSGKPVKVIKFASDITAQRNLLADLNGQIDAINKAQAVIQFDLDGTILDANENFTKTVGYSLDEIKGRHHSLFVDGAEREKPEYKQFWAKLKRGSLMLASIAEWQREDASFGFRRPTIQSSTRMATSTRS